MIARSLTRVALATIAALFVYSGPAVSALVSATSADFSVTTTGGVGGIMSSDRLDVAHVLDDDTTTFRSLGYGGMGVFSFGADFTGAITIWEATYGTCVDNGAGMCSRWPESISVYGSDTWSGSFAGLDLGDWTAIGTLGNAQAHDASGGSLTTSATFSYLLLVDNRSATPFPQDGFDLAGISVSTVPIPAAGWLFFSAIAGMIAVGRRRRA